MAVNRHIFIFLRISGEKNNSTPIGSAPNLLPNEGAGHARLKLGLARFFTLPKRFGRGNYYYTYCNVSTERHSGRETQAIATPTQTTPARVTTMEVAEHLKGLTLTLRRAHAH